MFELMDSVAQDAVIKVVGVGGGGGVWRSFPDRVFAIAASSRIRS